MFARLTARCCEAVMSGNNKKIYIHTYIGFLFYFTDENGQQNLTFFLSHEKKYIILIVLLTLNSNISVAFLHHPRFFL
jgi:hypothetical protein